jgi:hypothetical protein
MKSEGSIVLLWFVCNNGKKYEKTSIHGTEYLTFKSGCSEDDKPFDNSNDTSDFTTIQVLVLIQCIVSVLLIVLYYFRQNFKVLVCLGVSNLISIIYFPVLVTNILEDENKESKNSIASFFYNSDYFYSLVELKPIASIVVPICSAIFCTYAFIRSYQIKKMSENTQIQSRSDLDMDRK